MTDKRNLADIAAGKVPVSLLDKDGALKRSTDTISKILDDVHRTDRMWLAARGLSGPEFAHQRALSTAAEIAAGRNNLIARTPNVSRIMAQVARDQVSMSDRVLAALGGNRNYDRIHTRFATDELAALTRSLHMQSSVFKFLDAPSISDAMRNITTGYGLADKDLRDRILGISQPWAVAGLESASLSAAVGLGELAHLNRSLPAFGFERVALAEREFGSFDNVFVEAETAETEEAGEAIYTDAGRNPALVAFPSESYDDVLRATGWAYTLPVPDTIRADGTVVPNVTFDPHDSYLVTMIESHLRVLIIKTLMAAGGVNALKSSFGERLKKWEANRADYVAGGGEELHVVYSSNLMELHDIVINGTFWKSSFQSIFGNKEVFSVTMREIHAIRLQTAHSKPLTNTARLYLSAASLKLFHALKLNGLPN
jgi:hypothetical protein